MKKVALYLWMICIIVCCGLIAACENKPQRLTTPQNLSMEGAVLSWDEVKNASGYVVCYQSKERYINKCSYDLSVLTEPNTYTIQVRAKGDEKNFLDSNFASIEYTVTKKTEYVEPPAPLKPTENLKYTLLEDGSGYEVSRGNVDAIGALVIPETYQGLPVKKVGEFSVSTISSGQLGHKSNTATTSIHFPNTIEEISGSAFVQFDAITEIEIPSSVKVIGNGAFRHSTQLRKVTLSEGLLELGGYVFEDCTSLIEITLPDSLRQVGGQLLERTPWLVEAMQKDGLIVNNHVLLAYQGTLEEYLEIPSNIKHIAGYAFSRTNVVSVTIPDGVTLSEGAFSGAQLLQAVRLPQDLKVIPLQAFHFCRALKNVDIPDGVEEIGMQAFGGCTSLTNIILPAGLKKMSSIAFMNTGLREIVIPVAFLDMDFILNSFDKVLDNLEKIYYRGTEEEWRANVSAEVILPTEVTVYYYSETPPTTDGNYWHFVDGKPGIW